MRDIREEYDLAVIGAGPAGLAAASIAGGAGLASILIDENAGPGGQIYRAISTTPLTERRVLGRSYWHGQSLVKDFAASGAAYLPDTVVWSVSTAGEIGLSSRGNVRLISARRVIIATGALERPFPIPGWTLPGVMTAGAAQTMLKASGLAPGHGTALAGLGPLLWLLAAQILRAGGEISAILDTAPRGNALRALRHAAGFMFSPYAAEGLRLKREVARRVRVIRNVSRLEAVGDRRLEAVDYEVAGSRGGRIDTSLLLLHQGVVPNVNLALAAGVRHRWHARQHAFVADVDRFGATANPVIYVAGDGAGIAGARAAEERGRLAAVAAVRSLKPRAEGLPDANDLQRAAAFHETGRAFLDTLFEPPPQFRIPAGDTIVCRCEEVTAGDIRKAVAIGAQGPNQIKSYLRCGMGPCQGRLCGLTVTELIAAERGVDPSVVGYYRLRPPVKPITLGELASLPKPAAAVRAVERN